MVHGETQIRFARRAVAACVEIGRSDSMMFQVAVLMFAVASPLSAATLDPWVATNPTNAGSAQCGIAGTGGHVYTVTTSGAAESAAIQPDGSLGSWAVGPALVGARVFGGMAAVGSYLYVTGGWVGPCCTPPTNTDVEVAAIDPDGSLGAWGLTTPMPTARANHFVAASADRIYVLGNYTGSTSVDSAGVLADGSLSAWRAELPMNQAREGAAAAVVDGHLYVAGGLPFTSTVERAAIGADGILEAWEYVSSMNLARYELGLTSIGDSLFAVGGYNDAQGPFDSVEVVQTSPGGLGTWALDSPMTIARDNCDVTAVGTTLYAVGPYLSTSVDYATAPTITTTTTSTSTTTSTTLLGCGAAPRGGCIGASKGILAVKELVTGSERFKLVLKGLQADLSQGDFGDPATGTTRYDVCLYDDVLTTVVELTADRAGQVCGTPLKACWQPISTKGYRYKDRDASADGVQKIVAKGGSSGRGKVVVKAGNNTAKGQGSFPAGVTAALQGAEAVTVQVLTSDGECFGGTITAVSRADLGVFKASGPAVTVTTTSSTTTTTLASGCFQDWGDGTVRDTCSGLQWEQKTGVLDGVGNPSDLHEVDNAYKWAGLCAANPAILCQPTPEASTACRAQTPSPFWGVGGCDECAPGDGPCDASAGSSITTAWEWLVQLNASLLGGHGDWRLATSAGIPSDPTGEPAELDSIIDGTMCGALTPACIDPLFGPTDTHPYWSASTDASNPDAAWARFMDPGSFNLSNKDASLRVRAVR